MIQVASWEQTLELADEDDPRLIFLDPPFNIGQDYPSGDSLPEHEYKSMLLDVVTHSAQILSMNGSLWINIPDQWVSWMHRAATVHAEMELENWCIWHYRFGQWRRSRFINSKMHVLWFSHGDPIVNREYGMVDSDRASKYNDDRIIDSEDGGRRMDLDVWEYPRVQGNNKERRSLHPNQIPELYMKRVIGLCTNEQDLVVDPFCGSGTTATVCKALGRRCISGDINPEYVESAKQRVEKGMVR